MIRRGDIIIWTYFYNLFKCLLKSYKIFTLIIINLLWLLLNYLWIILSFKTVFLLYLLSKKLIFKIILPLGDVYLIKNEIWFFSIVIFYLRQIVFCLVIAVDEGGVSWGIDLHSHVFRFQNQFLTLIRVVLSGVQVH